MGYSVAFLLEDEDDGRLAIDSMASAPEPPEGSAAHAFAVWLRDNAELLFKWSRRELPMLDIEEVLQRVADKMSAEPPQVIGEREHTIVIPGRA